MLSSLLCLILIFIITLFLDIYLLGIFFPSTYFNEFIYLFILNFWLRWVFVAARGLSLGAVSGGYSSLRCTGFSLQWLLLLQSTGSSCAGSVVVMHGLNLLRSMWDLPPPGLEPVSPALAGGFLTTAPPGKSPSTYFNLFYP